MSPIHHVYITTELCFKLHRKELLGQRTGGIRTDEMRKVGRPEDGPLKEMRCSHRQNVCLQQHWNTTAGSKANQSTIGSETEEQIITK